MIEHPCPVVFATPGPAHHFFGYYDKSPIDAPGGRLLAHRADFDFRRMPRADDVVGIGYFDIGPGEDAAAPRWHRIGGTRTWNWQQGAQLQWLGPDFASRIVFNDRDEGGFVSRVIDVESGHTRTLPFPVYTVSPDGRTAICVNYPRLAHAHPGYHYEGPLDPRWSGELPPGDGLFRLDLESGGVERVIETRALAERDPVSSMRGAVHYLEHAMFDPSGRRFHFFHRWRLPDGGIYGRLYAADADGGRLRCLLDSGYISHCGWRGSDAVVGWGRPPGGAARLRRSRFLSQWVIRPLLPVYHALMRRAPAAREQLLGDTYLVMEDRDDAPPPRPLTRQRFPDDGHCSWRPEPGPPRWMLTDTYEDAASDRHLFLYDARDDEIVRIGRFHSLPETNATGYRADLHPRWDRSGTRVCIDSTHEGGERQMYVIDVSAVVGGPAGG